MPEATPAAPSPVAAPSAPAMAPAQSASSIDPAEHSRLQAEVAKYQRQNATYEGHKKFFESVTGTGFKPDEVLPALQSLKKANVNLSDFSRAFTAPEPEGDPGDQPLTMAAYKKLMDEERREAEKSQAQKEYEASINGEMGQFSREELKKLLGAGAPEVLVDMFEAAYPSLHWQNRQPFADDHLLKGKYGPAGPEGLGKVRTTMTGWAEKLRAHDWKSIGEDARATPTTIGAPRGGQPQASGKKDAKETPEQKARRFVGEAAVKIAGP